MFFTFKNQSLVDYGEKITPRANTRTVEGGDEYFTRMRNQELIDNAPVFDYFSLQTTDRDKPDTWEWIVLDIHEFMGSSSPVGWLISDHFKQILEQFIIAPVHRFYPAKLKYHDRKLDYFAFSVLWLDTEAIFPIPSLKFNVVDNDSGDIKGPFPEVFSTLKEFKDKNRELRNQQDLGLSLSALTVNQYYDFLPLHGLSGEIVISERLKLALEQSKIEGVIIKECPFEVIMPDPIKKA